MPRHRLMNRIRTIVRQQVAETTPDHPLLTRRRFLTAGSLALGALALPKSTWARAFTGTPRIAIVGGGIAGMVAAMTLQDNGISSFVYEASNRIGGRMHSNTGFFDQNQVSEWCGEFIDTSHFLLRQLAKRFQLTLVDVNAAEPPNSQCTNYFLGDYYTDQQLAHDLKPVSRIMAQQFKAVGPVVLYNRYTPAAYHFDHMSVYDWIETYVPGGHSSRVGRYIDLAINTENGTDTKQQTALDVIIPLDSDERFRTVGGNQQIPAAIAATLPPNSIQLQSRLCAIAANSDQTVTLSFSTPAGTQQFTFDYVILTLPFSVLRRLDISQAGFDPLKQTAIQQLSYGTNSKLVVQFTERYWNSHGPWPGVSNGFLETDLAFQSGWDTSRAQAGSDGLITNYTGGSAGLSFRPQAAYTTSQSSSITAGYAQRFVNAVEQVWPGGTQLYNGLAALSYPTGDRNLLGSYSGRGIGQYTSFGGYEGVRQGNVFFAGEHTSYNFQGFMEGGAESGRRAALEVLGAVSG